jgi:hypothetical protein
MKTKRTSRRQLLLGSGAAVAAHSTGALSAVNGFVPIAPGNASFAPDLATRLDKAIANGRVWNLHGLVVLRDGLVLERYFEGEDHVRCAAKSVHGLQHRNTPMRARSRAPRRPECARLQICSESQFAPAACLLPRRRNLPLRGRGGGDASGSCRRSRR